MKETKIKNAVYGMYPDEKNGVLYCAGGRVLMVDLSTGKAIGKFKGTPHCNQVMWDEKRERIIVKSTVGDFAVFKNGEFDEPIWRFKIKVGNTDSDFILIQNKIYGLESGWMHHKEILVFVIDLNKQQYEKCGEADIPKTILAELKKPGKYVGMYNTEEFKELSKKKESLRENEWMKEIEKLRLNTMGIPEKYHSVQYVSCYYENYRFEFVGSWNQLLIIPKGQMIKESANDKEDDVENYLRKNGLSKQVLEEYEEEIIIHGGALWAQDKIDAGHKMTDVEKILISLGRLEAEIGNGGFDQYLWNSDDEILKQLMEALEIVGAAKTLKVIAKSVKTMNELSDNDVSKEAGYEYFSEKFLSEAVVPLDEKLSKEDYVGLAVSYLKKIYSDEK